MMKVFKLEEYLGRYEFSAPYLLCCSDAETMTMKELLNLANQEEEEIWEKLTLGYTEVRGLPKLRRTIVENLYPSLDENAILTFSGAEDGIYCSLYALCDPEDHVIVLTPCYQSLKEIPMIKGCSITSIDLKEENDWRININAIKDAIQKNTKCVVINFPHNPTGQVITQEELTSLIKILDENGIYLFSDEVYRLLGEPFTPWAQPAAEIYPRAISLGVMSKSFGMAGLRIGWIACQDKELLKKIEYMKHYTTICNSAPAEILSCIAIKNKEVILERNNHITKENLGLLDNFMQKHRHLFSWIKPQGGCVGFVNYHGKDEIEDFCQRLVTKKGVLLVPASIYDHQSNHFRIGFGRKNMPEALSELEGFLAG